MIRILTIAPLFLFINLACTASAPKTEPAKSAPTQAQAPFDYDKTVKAASAYAERGNPAKAEALSVKATKEEPKRAEAWVIWGRSLAMQRKLKEAIVKYEKARSLGSENRRLYAELSIVYDVSGEYDKAQAVYLDYLQKHPDDGEMHRELGLTLLATKQYKMATDHLQKAVALEPTNMGFQMDYGYALLRQRQFSKAAEVLARVTKAEPANLDAARFLAQAEAGQGNAPDAISILNGVLKSAASDVPSLSMRARLFKLVGESEKALHDYQTLVRAEPNKPAWLLGAAGTLIAMERYDEAHQAVELARKKAGDHPLVRFRAAQISLARGDKKAFKDVFEFANSNPNDIEGWRACFKWAKKLGHKKELKMCKKERGRLGDL